MAIAVNRIPICILISDVQQQSLSGGQLNLIHVLAKRKNDAPALYSILNRLIDEYRERNRVIS